LPASFQQQGFLFTTPSIASTAVAVDVDVDVAVGGYVEDTDMPFGQPRPALDMSSTEEFRVQGSFILRMPFNECVIATAYSYDYDSFDKQ
jgi:hypothetical protein